MLEKNNKIEKPSFTTSDIFFYIFGGKRYIKVRQTFNNRINDKLWVLNHYEVILKHRSVFVTLLSKMVFKR